MVDQETMVEEVVDAPVEEVTVVENEPVKETLTAEELKIILDLRAKNVEAANLAEKALAAAKVADLENSNYTMKVFLKYKIDIEGGDTVGLDGVIVRGSSKL